MAINAANLQVRVGADTAPAERALQSFGQRMGSIARNMGMIGAGMSLGITAPMAVAARSVYKIGTDFETAFTGVVKTVNATAGELSALETGIRNMAKEMPASAVEIANVASAAGQLGIQTENILGFTEAMVNLGVTTNLTSETAATELARFANIMGMPQTEFERLGSTIVDLGNNMATTEAEIVAMGMRIASAGRTIGLSEAEVMGFAAALSSVGIEAEAGGTAISRVMIDMANAAATGGEELARFADVAGMNSGAFAELFSDDAAGAMIAFIEGLRRIHEEGGNIFAVMEELGFADVRVGNALRSAALASDVFSGAIDRANSAWEENIALSREAELRYQDTAQQAEIMKNRLKDFGITLFQAVSPRLDMVIAGISELALEWGPLVEGFVEANPALVDAALAFGAILAAAGPVIGIMAAVAGAFALLGPLAAPIAALTLGVAALAAAVATDFAGIGTAAQNVITDIQALWAELQKPSGAISVGPVSFSWTPEIKTIEIGSVVTGTLDLAERTAKLNIADWFIGTIDLTNRVAKLSFGQLLDISGQVGADGKIAVRFTGEDFDFELSDVIAKVKTQLDFLKTAIQVQFTGFENLTVPQKFTTVINAMLSIATALTALPVGEIGNVGPVLTGLATSLTNFATSVVSGVDTNAITQTLANVTKNISSAVTNFLSAEKLGELGTAVGTLASTLINKISETFGAATFGAEIGTAVGVAAGEVLLAAGTLITSFLDGLKNIDVIALGESVRTFADGFIGGAANALRTANMSPIADAIWQKIKDAFSVKPDISFEWEGFGREKIVPDIELDIDEQLRLREHSDVPRVPVVMEPIIDSPAIQGMASAIESAGINNQVAEQVTQGIQDGLSPNAGRGFQFDIGGLLVPGLTAGMPPIVGLIHDMIKNALGGAEPVTVPVTPTIDESAAGRRDAMIDAILGGQVALEIPATFSIEPQTQALRDAMISSVLPGGGESLRVPATPYWEEGIGGSESLNPVRAPVEVIELVLPSNLPNPQVTAEITEWSIPESLATPLAAPEQNALEAPVFEWPPLPEWVWPVLPVFNWPTLPVWTWPVIPRPSWLGDLQVPRPSWLGELLSWSPVVTVRQSSAPTVPGQLAEGTNYWRGGLTWVGEKGAELLDLPRGSRVYDHETSMEMAGAGGATVNVYATVNNEMDMHDLAHTIARIIDRKNRR